MTDSWPHQLLDWYRANARDLPWRNPPGEPLPVDPDWPYRVWLSEVMLQQTTVEAATPYFHAFTSRWPTVSALAAADDTDVMQAWAGLGYYARARNLLACARAVVDRHGAQFPSHEAELRDLPGIGDYTAAAVAAFGFDRDTVVIDGNVERVASRLFAIATPLPAARPAIRTALSPLVPPGHADDFAQAMMDLARSVCKARAPRCLACPLSSACAAYKAGTPDAFPVKAAKKARPTRQGTAWWIEVDGEVLSVIRPAKGLLGGMRALPSCDWRGGGAPPLAGDWQALGLVRHGFTHFDLELHIQALILPARPILPGDWLSLNAVESAGLPTLFAKAARLGLAADDLRGEEGGMMIFHDVPVTGFCGNMLDRADEIRRDPAALIAMRARPDARWLVLDGLNPVVKAGENASILWAYRSDVPHDALSIFLGVGSGGPRFAAAAPSDELVADFGGKVLDARAAGALLPAAEAAIVAQARSIIDWHQRHGFCAVCGGKTELSKAGYARSCVACKAEHFPRVDPVVIMLAIKDSHALIGRQPRFPKRFLSALAGFVEPGESLEEAVRRELWEEAGITTRRVRYLASQPWPFPSSLMMAAFAEADGFEVRLDEDELEEVRWVTKDDVRAALAGNGDFLAPPPLAIAHTLLKNWVEE